MDKTPVTVISGFLGSGKTTLLRRILRSSDWPQKLAVIVNDLGELGLDQELIAVETQTPTVRVTELTSGCICCTLQSELGEALSSLVRGEGLKTQPQHILIEPSGVARASEVSFSINALSFETPVVCDAVVTLVDLHNAERAYREHSDLFEDQVRSADLLVLNKIDLVPDMREQNRIATWLAEIAPRAQQVFASHGNLDAQLLLGQFDFFGNRTPPADSCAPFVSHNVSSDKQSAHGISAVTISVPYPLNWNALEDLLDGLADSIFRIKGIVERANPPGTEPATTPILVQAVGDRVDWDEIPAKSPLARAPRRLIFVGNQHACDETLLRSALEKTRKTN